MKIVEEMASFVQLWDLVQSVQLSDQQDQITWRWTSDGIYMTKSAYNAQFPGSFSTFRADNVWRADAEGKLKFFAWLLMQCKQTSYWFGNGHVTQPVLYAIWYPRQHRTSSFIAHLHNKFGHCWKPGHSLPSRNRFRELKSWPGGRRN